MFDEVRRWQGKAEELTEIIKQRIEQLELPVEYPTVRTVRLWRAKELFSQAKKQPFSFRQILEGLTTAILLKKGWTLTAIAQILPSFPDEILERQILAESQKQEPSWSIALQTTILPLPTGSQLNVDLAENAVILLAQGILVL